MRKGQHLIKLSSLRLLYAKSQFIKSRLKRFLLKSSTLFIILKQRVSIASTKLFYNKTRWNRRCVLTARTYAVNSNYLTSRFVSRVFISNGLISGIRRHSW